MNDHVLSSYVMQGLLILLVLCIVIKLAMEMADKDSPIEWWQLVATRGRDGNNYASSTKLWLNIGAVIVSWIVVFVVLQVDWDDRGVEVLGLVGMYLMFISGVEGYARHLKSKQGDNNVDVPTDKTSHSNRA